MGACGNAHAIEPLIKALGDGNENVREVAVEALGELGDLRAIEPLINVLGDRNTRVITAAEQALGKICDVRAVESLIKALGDRNFNKQIAASKLLSKLGDVRAVKPLIKTLGEGEGYVRKAAAKSLACLGDRKWHEIVKGDNEDFSRLGACGDMRAIESLIQGLQAFGDRGLKGLIEVRKEAAKALASFGAIYPESLIPHWELIGSLVRQPENHKHIDDHPPSDCSTDKHEDSGIGLPWPDRPPVDPSKLGF